MDYEKLHAQYKQNQVSGRYLKSDILEATFATWELHLAKVKSGKSVLGKTINSYRIGTGSVKVLMWSQMHGNETTTTKALIDFVHFLTSNSVEAKRILEHYCFCIVAVLNPDGSEVYTRVNANGVDLNRDFQDVSQPETRFLMDVFHHFTPHFCFNLHDQRTIFGAGINGKPATISFLAPSFDEKKTYNEVRLKAVAVINKMNTVLQQLIPDQIGRFDDAFNANCAGDTFQALEVPTILVEAGHFPSDYPREITRRYVFIALVSAFECTDKNFTSESHLADYLKIPQNEQVFFDFIYKNVRINYDGSDLLTNFAIQFQEEVVQQEIVFTGYVAKVGSLSGLYGHVELDAQNALYTDGFSNFPELNTKANFSLDSSLEFVNGFIKN